MKTQGKPSTAKRVSICDGYNGVLALCGYWTAPVQKIVREWRGKVSEHLIQDYFPAIGMAALWRKSEIQIKVVVPNHWPLIWELAAAVEKVRSEKRGYDYWLLTLPIHTGSRPGLAGTIDGRTLTYKLHEVSKATGPIQWPAWDKIAYMIQQAGGPRMSRSPGVSANSVKQAAKRLHIITPVKLSNEFHKLKSVTPDPTKV